MATWRISLDVLAMLVNPSHTLTSIGTSESNIVQLDNYRLSSHFAAQATSILIAQQHCRPSHDLVVRAATVLSS